MALTPSRNRWIGAGIGIVGLLIALAPVFIQGVNTDFSGIYQWMIYGGTAVFCVGTWISLIRSVDRKNENIDSS